MARYLLLTIAFFMAGLAVNAQTSIQGTVTDAETGEPIIFGTVALYRNDVLITGTETDLDGFYSVTEIDPGTYDVAFSYTGYGDQKITAVTITAGKANLLDAKMSQGIDLVTVEIIYEAPLIEQDNTSQGAVFSKEQIKNLPTRNVNGLVALGAGVSSADEGEDISIRGSRANATNYYLDGVRVFGSMIPKQDIEQLQVVTGGVEARYGDVTGGVISITTKGPSDKFSGGMELETSEYLDAFGQSLASLNLSGPILKRKGRTLLGYRVGGQYQYNKDSDPPATKRWVITDEYRDFLQENPIRLVGGSPIPEANFVTNENVRELDYNPNSERTRYDLTGKLDASLGANIDVTLSGSFYQIDNRITPNRPNFRSAASDGATWAIFNSHNNPSEVDTRYRANFRFRHRLGTTNAVSSDADAAKKGSLVQNAVYILQFGYENDLNEREDKRHGDNFFNYGYIGNEEISWNPTFDFDFQDGVFLVEEGDTLYPGRVDVAQVVHDGYTPVTTSFTPNTEINPTLANYMGEDPLASPITNGFVPTTLTNVWTNHHTNIGNVYNLYRRRDNDLYTFNANTSFELVPGGSGSARHNIQFGLLYEQRVRRGYDLNPFRLWQIAQQLENAHLLGQGLDFDNPVNTFQGFHVVTDDFTGDTLVYNGSNYVSLSQVGSDYVYSPDSMLQIYSSGVAGGTEDNSFFRKVREKFGGEVNEFFNVNALDPNDLTLDLFSAREINDQNIIDYWGYDYLGNQVDGVTFNDFFTSRDADGIRNFPVAAFRPNYQAAFIQDKFTFRDVIFRVGVRVDRYDANTKVLKDPYSLYEIQSAGDFDNITGQSRPGNIGDDFKVYVASEGGESVTAYRDGDTWYFPNGTPANDGVDIFGGQLVFPRYTEEDETRRDVTSPDFDPNISFQDYEPQVNWMPRLAFSFPISDEANFFAHYDVLVQRPPTNNRVSPLTYFYWEQRSGIRNNANLRPEKTIDYEVGFQQKLSNTSALKLSAYYKELRDQIQRRFFNLVPAPVNQYETYDNLDFATVKGFSVAYDLRRTGNVSLNLAYTLQFANGTGSDANSSQGLSANGIQRSLFPLSFDERHRITAILDYRYGSGKKYNGPRINGIDILANTGLNLTTVGVSGRPFTQAQAPAQFGANGRLGAINGSRLPWNFTVNAQIDKSFNLTKEGSARAFGLNVYLRVSNLFDRRNIQDVYRFTGSPSDDGFLVSSEGLSNVNAIANDTARSLESFQTSYSWRVLDPDNFSIPRRIFLGAIFDF